MLKELCIYSMKKTGIKKIKKNKKIREKADYKILYIKIYMIISNTCFIYV